MSSTDVRAVILQRLRRGLFYFLIFLLVLGSGRLIQKALGSHYDGDRNVYLQMLTADAVTIRWQTRKAVAGIVRYGLGSGKLDQILAESEPMEQHELRLTGLKPASRYYYSVGSEKQVFQGGGEDDWFVTAPTVGATTHVRFGVLGDPGYSNRQPGLEVRDAMLSWLKATPPQDRPYLDLLLTTGDNAYKSGKNQQYQEHFFEPYRDVLRNVSLWPAYGNHDARRWAFFDIFSLPEAGEAGGVASGTENYFSFDYANIHFVFLDSEQSNRSTSGAMVEWLKKDLAANKQQWLVSVFHHPPYTRGSHDSNDADDSDGRMTDMRENFLPVLEAAGVDLVLSGHSHMYERSYLLNGHYGDSKTLKPEMSLSKARGEYRKAKDNKGTIYAVVGSSSKLDQGPLDHPVMAVSLREMGSLVVDVEGHKLQGRFINQQGKVTDSFVIEKL